MLWFTADASKAPLSADQGLFLAPGSPGRTNLSPCLFYLPATHRCLCKVMAFVIDIDQN